MLPSPSSPAHLGTVPTLNATLLLEKEGPLLYLPWGSLGAGAGWGHQLGKFWVV